VKRKRIKEGGLFFMNDWGKLESEVLAEEGDIGSKNRRKGKASNHRFSFNERGGGGFLGVQTRERKMKYVIRRAKFKIREAGGPKQTFDGKGGGILCRGGGGGGLHPDGFV